MGAEYQIDFDKQELIIEHYDKEIKAKFSNCKYTHKLGNDYVMLNLSAFLNLCSLLTKNFTGECVYDERCIELAERLEILEEYQNQMKLK